MEGDFVKFNRLESNGALVEVLCNYLEVDKMNVNKVMSKYSAVINMTVAKTDHLDCFKTRSCDMDVVKIKNSKFRNIMT